jgi:hypothetical protein
MAQWVAGRCGISNWAARRWMAAAFALEHLPGISEAFSTGALGLDKVVELTRFATPATETKLIPWAQKVSPAAIRRRADLAARRDEEEAQEVHHDKFLRWWFFDDDRRMGLEGEFPATQGAAVAKAIRRVADGLPDVSKETLDYEPDESQLLEQRCADALSLIAGQAIQKESDANRATMVVHAPLDALLSGEGGGYVERGPVLHGETLRRLSCDARLQFVLTDKEGSALGIGETSRNIPPWLMRELRHRDVWCTFPGCELKEYLQAHHIRPFPRGPTELCNLVLTCHFHHVLLHEFGWKVRLERDDTTTWFRPDGSVYLPARSPPRLFEVSAT